jgi:hypothetical protein
LGPFKLDPKHYFIGRLFNFETLTNGFSFLVRLCRLPTVSSLETENCFGTGVFSLSFSFPTERVVRVGLYHAVDEEIGIGSSDVCFVCL